MAKIIHKKSSVPGKTPVAGDLDYGELAINYADGKLFYKDASNAIQQISGGGGGIPTSGGTANGIIYYNSSQTATSGTALSFDGTNFATTGTVSGTKLIPTGGTATGNGLYLPATNTLAISTDGIERMRIDSAGNVGIGTASPSEKLTVQKGNGGIRLDGAGTASSSVWVDYYVPNNGGVSTTSNFAGRIYAVSSGVVNFSDNSIRIAVPVGASATPVDTLTVKGGNVGIGTNNPTHKLHVTGGSVLFSGEATLGATASPGLFSLESSGTIFRQYVGAGTGNTWALSRRSGSTTLDILTASDSTGVVNFALATPTIQGFEIATKNYVDSAIDNNVNLKSISIFNPVAADSVTLLYTQSSTTISKLVAILAGTSPSVNYTIKYGTNRTTGTEIITGGSTANSTTTGNSTTVFNNSVIPANNFVWLEVTGVTGTVTEFHATINITFQ